MGKPKSKNEKKLSGNTRSDRINTTLPDPEVAVSDIPAPPKTLNKVGKEFYYTAYRHLVKTKAFWMVDTYILAQAAFWYELSEKMKRKIKGDGYVTTYKTGARQVSPELTVMDKAEGHLQKYFKQLGIGPVARQSIHNFVQNGAKEETDQISALKRRIQEKRAG